MAGSNWRRFALATCVCSLAAGRRAVAGDAATVKFFADTFAQAAISEGKAVGVGVGIAYKNQVFYTNAFGLADAANGTPFGTDTPFEIASITKVFTTNMLGQAVFNGKLKLSNQLSQFPTALGKLPPLTGKVTLQELADFTGGFPSLAPFCSANPAVPGCLPSKRPTVTQYGGTQFLDFFQHAVPENFGVSPPAPVSSLPAPYHYSDFAIGLLGLLIVDPDVGPMNTFNLADWDIQVQDQILIPLGMAATHPESISRPTSASGYSLALASAQLASGQISKINVPAGGSSYSAPPAVRISGGGGSGARATAAVGGGAVTGVTVENGGSGYIAPPAIVFSNGGSTTIASAAAIVSKGAVVAVNVMSGGAGYQRAPTVTISGGRKGGRDASAVGHIADGAVVAVEVTDGGAGYVAPLGVAIAPGGTEGNIQPIWGPAGALVSTTDDMTRFAAAAAGIASVQSTPVPASMAAGFRTAEKAYACQAEDPKLADCAADATRSGLAWSIRPADTANSFPEIVTKNGGLPGFSSEIVVVPSRQLGVIVLINTDTGNPAGGIALDIAHNLVVALP